MVLLILGRHLMWSRSDGRGGTISYYYYDAITWIVAALVLAWLTWFLVRRYRRAQALKRQPGRINYRLLKRVIKVKRDLTSRFLRLGQSKTIHAVGIGKVEGSDDYCIQVFVSDVNEELWRGAGSAALPDSYLGVPLVLFEMPIAGFSAVAPETPVEQYDQGLREWQDVILGGISGANTNLTGESGTIGYFCVRKSKLRRRKENLLLSNSHVFADLRKTKVDDTDLIVQPSPGEPGTHRPIGSLINFSPLKFNNDIKNPNHVDAAIATLWGSNQHKPVIPMIGAVKGYVEKNNIEIGETARKFGRTTGYTEGRVFSIYLDIWIRYDRTGQAAFFQDQFLIVPDVPKFTKFVATGDSGSLVVDAKQHAIGLIFGCMAELPETLRSSEVVEPTPAHRSATSSVKKVESYGVANPISDVMERLKIELLI